jgi:Putative glutamine amidotransferase
MPRYRDTTLAAFLVQKVKPEVVASFLPLFRKQSHGLSWRAARLPPCGHRLTLCDNHQRGVSALPNTHKRILLIGETWMSSASHFKGFDQFGSVTFHSGAEPLVKALAGTPFELIHMPAHEAVEKLPFNFHGLNA